MRDDDRLSDVERRLKAVLRPGDDAVARVATRALAPPHQYPVRRLRLIAASLLATVLVAAMVWRSTSPAPPALLISGSGAVVVVTSGDGRRWLIHGQRETPVRGEYVIAFPQ